MTVINKIFVLFLSIAIAFVGMPISAAQGLAPGVVHVVNKGDLFRIDYTGLDSSTSGQILLERASFPGDIPRSQTFLLNDPVDGSGFIFLDDDERAAAESIGQSSLDARWETVLRVDIESSVTHLNYRMTSRSDTIELSVPSNGEGYITLEINGQVSEISGDLLSRLIDSDPEAYRATLEQHPGELDDVTRAFIDPDGLWNVVSGFGMIATEVKTDPLSTTTNGIRCFGSCATCGIALAGYAISVLALIASCGSALVTGGATAVTCLIAFLGHEIAGAFMITSCALCGECLGNDGNTSCSCTGQPLCGCG